jgi:hypothetical protein
MVIFQDVYNDTSGIWVWKDKSEKCLLGRPFLEFGCRSYFKEVGYSKLTIANGYGRLMLIVEDVFLTQ